MEKVQKHFTATGIITDGKGHFLLHKHKKLGIWLPPGGHVDENEEPQDAVLREITEETGLTCQIINCNLELKTAVQNDDDVMALVMPMAILKERIPDKQPHWHIDMIYLCELTPDSYSQQAYEGFLWLSAEDVRQLKAPSDMFALLKMATEILANKGRQ